MPGRKAKSGGVWKHSPGVAWRKVADEAIVLDVETAVYYSLRGPGLRAWELLGQGKSEPEIVSALADEYAAGEDRIRRDFVRLLAALKKERLLARA